MFQSHMSLRSNADYAYGWVVREKWIEGIGKSIRCIEHFGSDLVFNNVITRLIDDGYVIILLINTSQSNLPFIRSQIINILYGQPVHCPEPISITLSHCRNLEEIRGN